jgi:aminotransferase
MTIKFSNSTSQLKQGGIRAFFDKAAKYPDAIQMAIGEPDILTPTPIIEAGYTAMNEGKTHYTSNAGDIALRTVVSKYLADYGILVNPDNEIIITCGAMGALFQALMCLVNEGDHVIVQDPQWLNYASQIKLFGGTVVRVPVYEEDAFSLKADVIRERISNNTKLIILNSPNNPTGAVISQNDLEQIAQLACEHDLFVISDEVYCELLYDGMRHVSIAALPGMKERTLVINSCSKTFAMTGWRIGFAAGPRELISRMTLLQENTIACASSFGQEAAKYAFSNRCDIEKMRTLYQRRRDILLEEIGHIGGLSAQTPKGAFYVFLNCSSYKRSSYDISTDLLEQAGVVTVPGICFGDCGEGFIRLAYSNSEENIRNAMVRIREFFSRIS